MPDGGMAFRKDCEDCGHSFLTPDRKAKFFPRCVGKDLKKELPGKIRTKDHLSKAAAATKAADEKRPPQEPAHKPAPQDSNKAETLEIQNTPPKSKTYEDGIGKQESGQTPADQGPETENLEIVLTEEQTKEIIKRYQSFVEVMKRPPGGRRKTIAAEMGLPYRAVAMTLRNWNQAQQKDLSREDRFSAEKAYFSFIEKENSFDQLKKRISRETELNPWSVSRYLDILHDGEDKLAEVPDISPEQSTAIQIEYNNYLAGSAPPGPSLHSMIAEKTGIKSKQIHKVLLAYRLGRFRERWG
jgi:hypothetical protein